MRRFFGLILRHMLAPSLLALISACGGGGGSSYTPAPADQIGDNAPPPQVTPDFTQVDAAFQSFIDKSLVFDGISYVVADAGGTLHTGTFGDHTEDTVVMLASTSKVPAVMTLMALEEDPASDFSMSQPIGEVLPFGGVYADRTPAQLVSNTSGIPGLRQLTLYGPHLCQFSFAETIEFEACGEVLLGVPLPDSHDSIWQPPASSRCSPLATCGKTCRCGTAPQAA